MNHRVYVVKCTDYKEADSRAAELISLMGGIQRFVKPGEHIVLKVNMLQPINPEAAVTTHPAVAAGIGKLVKQAGAHGLIADSPGAGFQYNTKTLQRFNRICGMQQAADAAGIQCNTNAAYETVPYPDGSLIKRFEVIEPILKADGVFNLCKMKTHLFMHMTGAVKNSFGVIPGLNKPGYHAKLHDTGRFARMLLDLSGFVSPRVSIMDAVMALEGDGPSNAGNPRYVGLLLGSVNPLALDVVAGEIMGIPRYQNPILIEAERLGLTPFRIEDVELVGAYVKDLLIANYKLPGAIHDGTGFGGQSLPRRLLQPLFKDGFSVRPFILKKECIACGACEKSCPVNAITVYEKQYAEIDDKKCIRCYCCHEMCRDHAITLKKSLLYQLFVDKGRRANP